LKLALPRRTFSPGSYSWEMIKSEAEKSIRDSWNFGSHHSQP